LSCRRNLQERVAYMLVGQEDASLRG